MARIKMNLNEKYGRLSIIKEVSSVNQCRTFECKCDCGNYCFKSIKALLKNTISSCGCFQKEFNRSPKPNRRSENYGHTNTRLYNIWIGIKKRCYNQKCFAFKWYGGKGIFMCDEWRVRFLNFMQWSIENGYQKSLTIDRIDSDKNYDPSNCRWIPLSFQNRNKKGNRFVQFGGEKMCIAEVAEKTGKPYITIISRLNRGLTIEESVL